jgi:hypothetical protein
VTIPIQDVLNRRTDLSTFVVHFTKCDAGRSAADNLRSIIHGRCLEARSPFGWARDQVTSAAPEVQASQRCVCFSEAPLQHLYSLVAPIEGRGVRLEPYGLALTKGAARRAGANPVWYVDMTCGREWEEAKALDVLRDWALEHDFVRQPAAKLLPLFEPMGTWPRTRREFSWEREWRKVGSLPLSEELVALWLCPEDEIESFEAFLATEWSPNGRLLVQRFVDPRWSVDQIIAALLGRSHESSFAAR